MKNAEIEALAERIVVLGEEEQAIVASCLSDRALSNEITQRIEFLRTKENNMIAVASQGRVFNGE